MSRRLYHGHWLATPGFPQLTDEGVRLLSMLHVHGRSLGQSRSRFFRIRKNSRTQSGNLASNGIIDVRFLTSPRQLPPSSAVHPWGRLRTPSLSDRLHSNRFVDFDTGDLDVLPAVVNERLALDSVLRVRFSGLEYDLQEKVH